MRIKDWAIATCLIAAMLGFIALAVHTIATAGRCEEIDEGAVRLNGLDRLVVCRGGEWVPYRAPRGDTP